MTRSIPALTDMYIKRFALFVSGDQVYGRLDAGFLSLMGCPYVVKDAPFEPVAEPSNAGAISISIPRLLTAFGSRAIGRVDVSSLLAGLHRNNCWRECLKTNDAAYPFTQALLSYIAMYDEHFTLDIVVEPDILSMLNQWVRPAAPWAALPSAREVCRQLFGDVWVGLVCSEEEAGSQVIWEVGQQRPPFLPGLCPLLGQWDDVSLPNLPDCS